MNNNFILDAKIKKSYNNSNGISRPSIKPSFSYLDFILLKIGVKNEAIIKKR